DTLEAGLDLISGGGNTASEAAQLREGAARDAFEREQREEQALAMRLSQAISTLEALQRQYADRLAAHVQELTQVERLKVHIRQNILHYMQAIWSHEPDDQRYLRLRNVPVPVLDKQKSLKTYKVPPVAMMSVGDFVG